MNFYTTPHKHYCGVDLHARSMYVCVLSQQGAVLLHRNLPCDAQRFLLAIQPFREDLVVAVECIHSWYWLADLCAREGISFVLGHALYMRAIHGAKAKNDRIDSHKTAALLRGGLIPRAYVYPAEMRATRDLMRRRMNPFLGRNFEAMDPLEWLARMSDHIPDPGQHRRLFYGAYANRLRRAVGGEPAGIAEEGAASTTLVAELGPHDRQDLPGGPAPLHSLWQAHEHRGLRHGLRGDRPPPRPPRTQHTAGGEAATDPRDRPRGRARRGLGRARPSGTDLRGLIGLPQRDRLRLPDGEVGGKALHRAENASSCTARRGRAAFWRLRPSRSARRQRRRATSPNPTSYR